MWDMEDSFYDREDIVAKIQFIQDLTSKYRYVGWKGLSPSFIERTKMALAVLPSEHRAAALALFSSVIYLPRPFLDEAWRQIVLELKAHVGWTPQQGFDDALILAVDDAGLVTTFSHIAGIPRRENHDVNPAYGTVSELIDSAIAYRNSQGHGEAFVSGLRVAKGKRWWILLTDNALSGGSAKSDIKKLLNLRQILCPEDSACPNGEGPDILLCARIATRQALEEVESVLPLSQVFYGIGFDDRCRVSSDECMLFNNKATLDSVRKLCEWFGDVFFVEHLEERFRERLKAHTKKGGQSNYAFGWRDCGYTIVTEENCPSNSVPVLYYTPTSPPPSLETNYVPPFPRTESRETHRTSKDKANLKRLLEEESVRVIRYGLDQLEGMQ